MVRRRVNGDTTIPGAVPPCAFVRQL
jgi:hypothetical protein